MAPFLVFLCVKDTEATVLREKIVYHVLKEETTWLDVHTFVRRVVKQIPDLSGGTVTYREDKANAGPIDLTKKVKETLPVSGSEVLVTVPAKEKPAVDIQAISVKARGQKPAGTPVLPASLANQTPVQKQALQKQMKEKMQQHQEKMKARLFAQAARGRGTAVPHEKKPNPLITFSNVPPKKPGSQ